MSTYFGRSASGGESAPAHVTAHLLTADNPHCGCGLPREECVRQRMLALWLTSGAEPRPVGTPESPVC
jgi:hypothetical protein